MTLNKLAQRVCDSIDIELSNLKKGCRKEKYVDGRQAFSVIAKRYEGYTYEEIAEFLGYKGHQPIIHLVDLKPLTERALRILQDLLETHNLNDVSYYASKLSKAPNSKYYKEQLTKVL